MALKFAVNNSLSALTSLPTAIPTGSMTLLQTQTASSSATIDFTSNIDSTYDSYVFKFINMHPATDDVDFEFNLSADGGSNYNVTKTSSAFLSFHSEDDSSTLLAYSDTEDLAQSTGYQAIGPRIGNGNDESCAGTMQLFNPSSTTFVKHFIADVHRYYSAPLASRDFTAGYGNTTSAINAIQFRFGSGNIDSGVIKMYGIK
jgi:hypothetical protein